MKSADQSRQEQEDRERQAATQRWTIGTGVVMAFLTVALIYVGVQQHRTYLAQLATTKVIERAYLSVQEIGFEDFGPNRSPQLRLRVVNTGHLPAHLISEVHNLLTDVPLPDMPEYEGWIPAAGAVAPNASRWLVTHFTGDPTFSQTEWNRIVVNEFEIHVFGAIKYLDGFGQEERQTGYAFSYAPILLAELSPGKRFAVAPNGNYHRAT